MTTVYDENVQFYVDFVDRGLAEEPSLLRILLAVFDELIGPKIDGARVCDVACGEGYVTRHLAGRGAASVVGIDISAELIEAAKSRTSSEKVSFRTDDAQELRTIDDASIDIVVSQMSMMDIADHRATFAAVRRVLTDDGSFVFSLLHPCLDGSPFHLPERHRFVMDGDEPVAFLVHEYATEGYWQSGGSGVRGHMGSYHRMLSTYVNDLIAAGFVIRAMREPVVPTDGLFGRVPRVLVVACDVSP